MFQHCVSPTCHIYQSCISFMGHIFQRRVSPMCHAFQRSVPPTCHIYQSCVSFVCHIFQRCVYSICHIYKSCVSRCRLWVCSTSKSICIYICAHISDPLTDPLYITLPLRRNSTPAHAVWVLPSIHMSRILSCILTPYSPSLKHIDILSTNLLSRRTAHLLAPCVSPPTTPRTHKPIWINESSVNPKSTSNQPSKPCTVLQYPSRNEMCVTFMSLMWKEKLAPCVSPPKFWCHIFWHPILMSHILTSYFDVTYSYIPKSIVTYSYIQILMSHILTSCKNILQP